MPELRNLGRESEDAVARYLSDLGWVVLKRRFRSRRGEIDIVALDGEFLVAVEVKARTHDPHPEASVDAVKQSRMKLAIEDYLASVDHPALQVRFDVVAITGSEMRHHEDAFR